MRESEKNQGSGKSPRTQGSEKKQGCEKGLQKQCKHLKRSKGQSPRSEKKQGFEKSPRRRMSGKGWRKQGRGLRRSKGMGKVKQGVLERSERGHLRNEIKNES